MHIGYREGVSIGLIAVYVPSLFISNLLAFRHGLLKSGGWLFLISFSLARIIGAGFQLASASNPTITNFTASAILTNIGFGPLELAALSLLSRLSKEINKTGKTIVTRPLLMMAELMLTAGVILNIVGGVNAGNKYDKTGKFILGHESVIGTALVIAVFAFSVLATFVISFSMHHAPRGEHRLFWALVVSLPFLAVRLVYMALSTYSHAREFSLLGGNTTILLCVGLIEELVVVVIYEGVGLTIPKAQRRDSESTEVTVLPPGSSDLDSNKAFPISAADQAGNHQYRNSRSQTHGKSQENLIVTIVKYLFFVQIIEWAINKARGK